MVQSAEGDTPTRLRALLAQGRYQDVLDLHRAESALGSSSPGVALAVATAATRLGFLTDGETLASDALSRFRNRVDDDGQMRCLNLLGAIAYERGRLDDASFRFAASLDFGRRLNDIQSTARASNNLASVAFLRGRVEESRSLFREALLSYQRLGDRRGIAETHHNLGIVARETGQIEEAGREAEEAVRHAAVTSDPALAALATVGQAETAVADGEFALAAERLDRSEKLAAQAGDEVGVAETNRVRAELALLQGDPVRALEIALAGRATAERFSSTQLQGECAALGMRAARRLGRSAQAAGLFAEAERLFLALGAVLHLERLRLEPSHD